MVTGDDAVRAYPLLLVVDGIAAARDDNGESCTGLVLLDTI